jgi:hypothetical protein
VLLYRETLEGDLQYQDPDETEPIPRSGSTLFFAEPRVTVRERLMGPRRAGRKAIVEACYVIRPEGTQSVGREPDNQLVLKDPSVSAHHAKLHPVAGTDWVFLTDDGSRNGTGHNGVQVMPRQRAELMSGDEVTFGRQVFVFLTACDLHKYLTGGF